MAPTVSLTRLRSLLASTSRNADVHILHLARVLQSAQGIEALVTTLAFTLSLVHSQLTKLLTRQYEKIALSLVSRTSEQLLPGETAIATLRTPHTRLAELNGCVKEASDLLIDVWVFTRLWGLVGIYKWARETWASPPRDPAIKTLIWGQILSASLFQAGENVAYLAMKSILPKSRWPADRAAKWMTIACRFWMAQTVLEVLRLLRVRQLRYNEDFGAQEAGDEKDLKVQSEELKKQWKRDWYAQMGWLPLTLHLSYMDEADSPISEAWQSVCGLVPSVLMLQDVWGSTV